MATQAIRFLAPPGQTITLDVFTLDSDTAEQSALVCTEATNRKGLYVTANFTDTLAGRHILIIKLGGVDVGNDFVMMSNTNGTYDAESVSLPQGSSGDLLAIEEDVAAIKEKTDQINAYDVYPPTRQQNNDVAVFIGETTSLTFTTSTDYSSNTLKVVWQEDDKVTVVAVVNDGDLTKTTTTITVDALPSAVTTEERVLYYSIRDALDGDRVLAHGKCFVKYAATSS